jgi:hypothetical protein
MAKGKFGKDNDNQHVGNNPVNFEQSSDGPDVPGENNDPDVPGKKDTVILVFKQNRKKELHIGRDVYTFWGASSLTVPRSVVEHSDFKNHRREFLVKEVK